MSKYSYNLPSHRIATKRVRVAGIKTDPKTQRRLNKQRVREMAANFIPEAAGTVVLSQRADGMYAVDGQHRVEAARLAGVEFLLAEIHYGLTPQQEAILFLLKNREAKKPSPIDEYNIGVEGEIPLYVDTDKVLKNHGLTMGSSSTNSVGAVNGTVWVVETYGPLILDWTLTVLEDAFGREKATWDGMLLTGLGRFLGEHQNAFGTYDELKQLAKKMARFGSPSKWFSQITTLATVSGTQQSGTGGRRMAAYSLVLQVYNTKRAATNRLDPA